MGKPLAVQILVTSGPDAAARARLGLDAALAAAASGTQTTVMLMLDATAWACTPRRARDREIHAVLDQLLALGAEVDCCSTCALDTCGGGRSASGPALAAPPATTPGIQLVGLTTMMERVANGVPTISF